MHSILHLPAFPGYLCSLEQRHIPHFNNVCRLVYCDGVKQIAGKEMMSKKAEVTAVQKLYRKAALNMCIYLQPC